MSTRLARVDGRQQEIETGHEKGCRAASCTVRIGHWSSSFGCGALAVQHSYWQVNHTFMPGPCTCGGKGVDKMC